MSAAIVPRLLVADDERSVCAIIDRSAVALGFQVEALTDAEKVLKTLEEFQPAVLVLDLKMPNIDGIELLRSIGQLDTGVSIVLMSGMDRRTLNTAEKLAKSYGLSVLGVLHKPFRREQLEEYLRVTVDQLKLFSPEDLEAALRNGEFAVHYQPKIFNGPSGWTIEGTEALVRWQHPTHGLLMPDHFLGAVEKSNLMEPLTDHVLHTAVQELSRWRDLGIDLAIAVNISADTIDDLEFPDRLQRLLEEYDLPGSKLGLELTETTAMGDLTKAMDIFLRLRMNDIELAIDDFGTGFSSLQKLYQLPFNELKIDKSFVFGLPGSDEARAVVRATVDLAHAMNMVVCAEGVESAEALDYLATVKCDRAQGYLVSKAVPASQMAGVIEAWGRCGEKMVAQR